MSELITINNVRGYSDENGTAQLSLEDVARGLGFTETKDGREYVRWRTVNGYLKEFGFSQLVAKDDFVPENIFYKLCFKANNETARKFQDLVTDEILPAIRKRGIYATDKVIDEILADPDYGIRLLSELKSEREHRKALQDKTNKLQQQLDESKSWYTIKRVAQINGVNWKTLDWKILKRQSVMMNKQIQKIFDANFGEVNLYHIDVFRAVYPRLRYM